MKSMRRDLLLGLTAVLLLVMGLSAVSAYVASAHEIDEVFDARLAQYARLLHGTSPGAARVPVPQRHRDWIGHKYEAKIAFQVYDVQQQLASASENAEREPLGPFEPGFHDRDNGQRHWRVFVLQDPETDQWYMVGESREIRSELVRDIALTAVLPPALGTLLALALLGGLLVRGFRPLGSLAEAITRRRADDLTPIALDAVPAEILPLVANINALLQRVHDSIERERRFSADAAHEIRTPLAAVKLHLANVLATARPEDRPVLVRMETSLNDIQRLVGQLLLLNRLEPGALAQRQQPVPVLSLCRDILAEEAVLALEQQQDLHLDADDDSLCVPGDSALLQVLLRNLIHNAVIYTPAGGAVTVRVYRLGQQAVIEVNDTGPGIPAEERERVFERFYRVGGDTHASGVPGSGLGLAIVREIVALHGGRISLQEGNGGRGLCVQVVLPAA